MKIFFASVSVFTLFFRITPPIQGQLSKPCTSKNIWTCTSILGILCVFFQETFAQTISINTGAPYNSATYLVQDVLVGGCISVENISYTGNPNGIGYFSNGASLGLNSGIVLSSGSVTAIAADANSFASTTFLAPGDAQLDALNPNPSNDAAVLQFDFRPISSSVSFDYVFASEEYPEWVGSAFNDVFGFFISGPGITGSQNIALIPGTSTPVGINFVNVSINNQYYITNTGTENVFDAYTTVFTATISGLTPCQTYHIKLAICDTQDWSFDSAVFLEANSFDAGQAVEIEAVVPYSTTGAADAYEGCQDGYFSFTRNGDLSIPLTLNLNISGTATPGADYVPLPTNVTIPPGQSQIQIPITAFADALPEGFESIIVQVNTPLCNCAAPLPATMQIYDSPEPFQAFSTNDITICPGDDVLIAILAQGSQFTPYEYLWSNGISSAAQMVAPTTNTTYTITITDQCGRAITGAVVVDVSTQAPDATISAPSLAFCATDPPVQLESGTQGGIWSGPGVDPNSGVFDPAIAAAAGAGSYTISYSLNNNCGIDQDQVQISVNPPGPPTITPVPPFCGTQTAIITLSTDKPGGTWSGSGIVGGTNTTGEFDPALAQASGNAPYTITYNIPGNCGGSTTTTINTLPLPTANISGGGVVCGTASTDLSLTLTGTPPFSVEYAIDGAPQTPISTSNNSYSLNVSQSGTYTILNITDANNCNNSGTGTATVTIGTLNVTPLTSPALCNGSSDGSIDLQIIGGQSPYTFSWSDTSIGNTSTASNLLAGTYSVTVTDLNGCTTSIAQVIDEPPPITIDATAAPTCANANQGSINLSVGNANIPFNFSWNNTTAIGQNPTNLPNGNYSVTVTDNIGCTATAQANIDLLPEPQPTITAPNTLCDGSSATLAVSPTFSQYAWSNGESTQTIQATSSGNYTVTVTSQNSCTASASHTIAAAGIQASAVATDITCNGFDNGSIELSITGATEPINFVWNNPTATGRTPQNLSIGNYQATVTDALGCTATAQTDIEQPTPLVVSMNTTNETCANSNNGTATIEVSGGVQPYTFVWNGATLPTIPSQTDISAGTYTATITDQNTCTATTQGVVSAPQILNADATVQEILCNGTGQGGILVNVTGGTQPYAYLWDDSNIGDTANPQNLTAGNYSVTITDNNNCQTSLTTTIQQPDPIALNYNTQDATCNGIANGSIFLEITGGSAPYTFVWIGGLPETEDQTGNAPAGTYSVTITDINGCVASIDNILVGQPDELQLTVIASTNETCPNNNDGTAQVQASGGTQPYWYEWADDHDGDAFANNLAANTHTATVTDINGCTASASFNIEQPDALQIEYVVQDAACAASATGSIDVNTLGGLAPYLYEWQDLIDGIPNQTDVPAGSYQLQVSDANGCQQTATITVNEPPALNLQTLISPASCQGTSTGNLTINVSGGVEPYTYDWTAPLTDGIPDQQGTVAAGNYGVTVTDAYSCTAAANNLVVAEPTALSIAINTSPASCGQTDGSAIAAASGGTAPYNYDWSNNVSNANTGNVEAGAYVVTVTDQNGCIATQTTSVANENGPEIAVLATQNTTCSSNNGSITVDITVTTSSHTLIWSNGATTESLNNLNAGNYTITVTDANDCPAIQTITITDAPGPSVVIDNFQNATCQQDNGSIGAAGLGGTGSLTYLWSNGNTSTTVNGLGVGNYSVTVTDENTCTASISQEIVNTPIPQIQVVDTNNETCSNANGSISIAVTNATGGIDYQWTGAALGSNDFADNLSEGTYTVVVTDSEGCTNSASASIVNLPAPVLTTDNIQMPACQQATGSITLSATGGSTPLTYTWSNNNALNSPQNNTLVQGTYTATVTDANGCTDTATATLADLAAPQIGIDNTQDALCGENNGTISASASGGTGVLSYAWSHNALLNSPVANNLAEGTYTVSVADANGCMASTDATIVATQAPTLALDNTTDANCGESNGTATVVAQGGTGNFVYTWSNDPNNNSAMASGLSAGGYTVTVTDQSNCTAALPFSINNDSAPTISNIILQNPTCGLANGEISFEASGGTGTLNYQWSSANIGNSNTALGLAAGNYFVTVSDENNCQAIAPFALQNQAGPSINLQNTVPEICGQQNGQATVLAQGGTAPLSYEWQNNVAANTPIASGLAAGSYAVTVTDANNCTAVLSFNVSSAGGMTLLIQNTQAATCNAANGAASVLAQNTTGAINYQWSHDPALNAPNASNLSAGIYNVTASDAGGCLASVSLEIDELGSPQLALQNTMPETCGAQNGSISIEVSNGANPIQYQWSHDPALNNPSATNLSAGDYTVTATDANGCSDTLNASVAAIDNLLLTLNNSAPETCGGQNGSITVGVSNGANPIQYQWSHDPALNNPTATNLSTGDYTVTVTDANTCSDVLTVNIEGFGTPTLSLVNATPEACNAQNGVATASANNGTQPYTYQWSHDPALNNPTATNLSAGDYTLTVTDANQCADILNIIISALNAPLLAETNNTQATCGQANGSLLVETSGGTTPYTYQWSHDPTLNDTSATSLVAGNYTVTVTDQSGCTDALAMQVSNANAPSASTSTTPTACEIPEGTASVTATGGAGGYTYLWSDGQTTATATDLLPGTYNVTVTDANLCAAVVSATVGGFMPPPSPTCGLATDSTLQFVWQPVPGASAYQISIDGALPIELPASPTMYELSNLDGEQTVQISLVAIGAAICGSSQAALAQCTTLDPDCPPLTPQITGLQTAYCADAPVVELQGTPSGGVFSGNGVSGNTFDPAIAGQGQHLITYNYTDANACLYSNTQNVVIAALPQAALLLPDMICAGETASVVFTGNAPDNSAYSWTASGGQGTWSGTEPHSLSWNDAGYQVVTLSIETPEGCIDSIIDTIAVSSASVTASVSENNVLAGTSIELFADAFSELNGDLSLQWQTIDPSIQCTTCPTTNAQPQQTAEYLVTATDAFGCIATATVWVNVYYENAVIMPNAFTPDGYGNNNVFRANGRNISEIYMEIRNRWGNKLFELRSNDLQQGWNGKMPNGDDAPIAVYAYFVKVRFADGAEELVKGNVTLIR